MLADRCKRRYNQNFLNSSVEQITWYRLALTLLPTPRPSTQLSSGQPLMSFLSHRFPRLDFHMNRGIGEYVTFSVWLRRLRVLFSALEPQQEWKLHIFVAAGYSVHGCTVWLIRLVTDMHLPRMMLQRSAVAGIARLPCMRAAQFYMRGQLSVGRKKQKSKSTPRTPSHPRALQCTSSIRSTSSEETRIPESSMSVVLFLAMAHSLAGRS